ncbi:hypothetical protein KR52_05810 [Synechococcus sp. KORDI-52]|uniref:excisionase family protein n=1 Tax=Synechococcus sp. KORDI-52 TaxID=585425 RepID=UPI0004E04DB3|nr:excisionase family protein [Synechococcus sp. KORDI-52]AII48657.1 hypothetical protein KR52_05810 [Synechococcus sp. KORDI-52]
MSEDRTWVSTQEMAKALGLSPRTLSHYRLKHEFLIEGRHYRRKTPADQAPWQWHLQRTTAAWAAEVGA